MLSVAAFIFFGTFLHQGKKVKEIVVKQLHSKYLIL
jgi:hypothetical protein